jgi:hypothetical protein
VCQLSARYTSGNPYTVCTLACHVTPSDARLKGNFQLNEIVYKLECNTEAIEIIKSLEVDAIILEPTGYWYASFWVNCANHLGLKVYWISHQQVKINRSHYGQTKKALLDWL